MKTKLKKDTFGTFLKMNRKAAIISIEGSKLTAS